MNGRTLTPLSRVHYRFPLVACQSAITNLQWENGPLSPNPPHMMVIVPDPSMLGAFSTDPESGEPYVMWKGTPYSHLMVPVADH